MIAVLLFLNLCIAKEKLYNIRDLSWLSFNGRVLQEAENPEAKLIDRLKFLGIFSNNLDEFYRVRVATNRRMMEMNKETTPSQNISPEELLNKIQSTVAVQRKKFDTIFGEITQKMAAKDILILKETQLDKQQQEFVTDYFDAKVRTSIVPLMMESIPEMPVLKDGRIYLACVLKNSEYPIMQRYALIEIPTNRLPRFVMIPSSGRSKRVILLDDIIRYNLPNLFSHFGYNLFSSFVIKLTRDAEMDLEDESNDSYTSTLRKALKSRKKGKAVRFIYDKEIDGGLLTYLIKRLGIDTTDEVIAGGRIHNFKDFMRFPEEVFRRSKQPRIVPFIHPKLKQPKRIMEVLDKEDVMLHFPYHSFDSIIDLLREAAIDPQVEKIKLTAYRLAKNSKIVHALISAANNGKLVSVVIELQARFDENNNLQWKSILEENGVQVYLGIPNMKVHSKICLITKTHEDKRQDYAIVSTGNFHEGTARVYADHAILTSESEITKDLHHVFKYLEEKDAKRKETKTLITSPSQTRDFFLQKIREYADLNTKKERSRIFIKLNSLVDQSLISALYDAHRKGCDVFLNIRSICCAKTQGLPGFQKDIPAISIVDNLLEHARVQGFVHQDKIDIYIGSADWMVRNLDHRVETICPIHDPEIKEELMHIYDLQMQDNVKARVLDNAQSNTFAQGSKKKQVRSQIEIYQYLKTKKYK